MIEAFRKIEGSHDIYKVKNFAPFEELTRILRSDISGNTNEYLNVEFRASLQKYGQDFDYPIGLRSMGRLFKKSLQRRAGIMIAENSERARVLVVETDSRFKDVNEINQRPHDAHSADITIWPMQMRKVAPSKGEWFIKGEDEPTPYNSSFFVSLKKIGESYFADAYISAPDTYASYWKKVEGVTALDLLSAWSGLK